MSIPISPADQPGKRTLIDGFFRTVTYLRVSVTDRCDLRCVYCMSPDMTFLPRKELLTLDELDRVCSAFVARGVRKLRLTGGEPLMRRGFLDLVHGLSRHLKSEDLQELTLTTNGTQLSKYAADLAAFGVRRINVSLDTLDADSFKRITRGGDIAPVVEGTRLSRHRGAARSFGQYRQLKQKPSAARLVAADRDVPLKLPHQTGDDLEPEVGSRLVDVKSLRQADAVIGNLDVKAAVNFVSGDVDRTDTTWVSIFDRVRHELVDQKAEGNGVVGRNQHWVGVAIQTETLRIIP
jgi:hypothetical protein